MDNFAEQLVVKNETSSDKTKKILTIIGGILITLLLAFIGFTQLNRPIMGFAGLILAAAAGYGTFFLVQSMYVEYEYTFTNGEIEVAKIIAKKRRVELITADVRKFTAFGTYTDDLEETEDMTVVIASDNIAKHEYYADFQHEDYGKTRLVFSPDERILDNISKFLPRQLRK
ncbi:MAG: hypothetical protein IKQ90_02910 [Ruminococcus sp.]|nr:hypothetical protein [Ruminococcus sp.]